MIVITEESVLAPFAVFPQAENEKLAIATNKVSKLAVDLNFVAKELVFCITYLELRSLFLGDVKISSCNPAYLFYGSCGKIDIWVFFCPRFIYQFFNFC